MLTTRNIAGVVVLAASLWAAAGSAQASSIVYVKSGNVWLSSPDGAQSYELTFGGGWSSPSQANDGTVMAVKSGQTYRFTPAGQQLGPPADTIFAGADPTTTAGPFGARISPDGTKQAYWGTVYTSYEDFTCGCTLFRWEAVTRWGASDQFSEPNQTRGQELYGEPAWIDNGTLLLSNIGSVFGDQVDVYTVGGGDNSLTGWFSDPDPTVKQLQFGTITSQRDKLAFVASTQNAQDELRIYVSTGPIPSPPTAVCALTGAAGGQFSYPSFSPDGTELAWQDAAGVHLSPVSDLSNCSTIIDQLILPGAGQPSFGPANFNLANAPSPPGGGGTAGGGTSGGSGSGTSTGTPGAGGGSTTGSGAGKPPHGRHRKIRHRHGRRHRRRHPRGHGRAVRLVARLRSDQLYGILHSAWQPMTQGPASG